MTLREIAAAVSGTVHDTDDEVVVTAPAAVDSRKVLDGGLFVALPGDRVDGHDYVDAAVAGGAAAVLAHRPVGAPAVVVPDGAVALGKLARHLIARRAELDGPGMTLIGITGSAGKTTTKDLVAHLVGGRGKTVATPGNFNNEIGLPLTVSLIEPDTRLLVLEMGARGIGHIAYLTGIAPPQISVVTNIGSAHIGEFGGYAATAKAKGELVEALPPSGLAVLNADDERVLSMRSRTQADTVLFGLSQNAEIRADGVALDAHGRARFTLHTPEGAAPVAMLLTGEHQVLNALAAAAVARRLGASVEETAYRLSSATPSSRGRMEISERRDGVTVVNDAYNSNPHSIHAAFNAVRAMARGRRTVAVLGAMIDMGTAAEAEHRAVGALASEMGIDVVVTVSRRNIDAETQWIADGAEWIGQGAAGAGVRVLATDDIADARALLDGILRKDDVVLVKASQLVGLQQLGEQLQDPAGT